MERLADRAGVDRSFRGEAESRHVGSQGPGLLPPEIKVGRQSGGHLRSEGHKARLPELRATNNEQVADEIDICNGQTSDLPDTQSKSVEDGEDRCVGRAAADCSVVIRQRRRDLDEPAGLRQIEEIGNALRRHPARSQPERRGVEPPLIDHPIEQAPQDAEQMIVAAWALAWSAGHKRLDCHRCDIAKVSHAKSDQIAIEQSESFLLGIEPTV